MEGETMVKDFRRGSVTYLAYVLLLMAFVSLGIFVAALATESDVVGAAGAGLIACLGGAVAGFRKGSRTLAESTGSGDTANNLSIFSVPLRRDQIDRYLKEYRDERGNLAQPGRTIAAVAGTESDRVVSSAISRKPTHAQAAGSSRLSA
jgi:hypothetical protein